MKYLKSFNEELSPRSYMSAAHKLGKMGHSKRADALKDWARETEGRESIISWKKKVEEYSEFGSVKLDFYPDGPNNGVPNFSGDFYLCFTFDEYGIEEAIEENKEKSDSDFEIPISFSIGIIPVDEENLKKCIKCLPDPDFSNGFFWAMWLSVRVSVVANKITSIKITTNEYDGNVSLYPSIADRRSANVFRKYMISLFDENSHYPSGYTDYSAMYDKLNIFLTQKLELGIDYNFTMEKVHEEIKKYPINRIYQE